MSLGDYSNAGFHRVLRRTHRVSTLPLKLQGWSKADMTLLHSLVHKGAIMMTYALAFGGDADWSPASGQSWQTDGL